MSIVVHTNTLNSLLLIENSSCHIKVEISARVNYVCMHTHSKKKHELMDKKSIQDKKKDWKEMQSPSIAMLNTIQAYIYRVTIALSFRHDRN